MLTPSSTNTPMIDTAVLLVGPWGGYLFAFAGLLATVSSINTAILASSSRTSYALSKDRRFPSAFSAINRFTKTPVLSIIMAGLIAAISTSLQNLERISTITALFSLIGYSFVNIAVIQLRKQKPTVKRAFKVPFFPLLPHHRNNHQCDINSTTSWLRLHFCILFSWYSCPWSSVLLRFIS